jgi:uncharacterized RDD family membrane protein YckC
VKARLGMTMPPPLALPACASHVRTMNTTQLDISGRIERNHDDWRLFAGVRSRRMIAFCLDYLLILLLAVPFAVLVFLLGIVTLGLGFLLFSFLLPGVALLYFATTLGGSRQATPGMRFAGLGAERIDGQRIDPLLAIVHAVLFWAGNALLTPLILLATFVFDRKRLVHDVLTGIIIVRK